MTGTNFSSLLSDYEKEIFIEDAKSHFSRKRRINLANLIK
jgi:hypothetical protein